MTKKEQAEMDDLRAFKANATNTNSAGQDTVREPNAGYLNQGEKPRASIILKEDIVEALSSELVDGHVGLTI